MKLLHLKLRNIRSYKDGVITVARTMRKGSAIKQDECSIFIDGKEYKYTPTQLKAKIIDLFGYPKEAASRNIPIFRYTVYTPQEQMKGIMADPDARLATLRKQFGIATKGNIRNNSA